MDMDNNDKINALISLANRTHAETMRYRDHMWKILVWTVLLLAATLAATRTSREFCDIACSKWPLCLFAVFVVLSGIWNITFDYRQFIKNRNWQRKCGSLLKFFEKGAYVEEESLLPEGWGQEVYGLKDCFWHYIQYMAFIVLIALYVIVSIALIKPAG